MQCLFPWSSCLGEACWKVDFFNWSLTAIRGLKIFTQDLFSRTVAINSLSNTLQNSIMIHSWSTTGDGVLLSSQYLFFCTENAKLWHILAKFGYFVANLRTFWCTFIGLNNLLVFKNETLPKALRTQALTALTSNFGLVGLVQYAWKATFNLVW